MNGPTDLVERLAAITEQRADCVHSGRSSSTRISWGSRVRFMFELGSSEIRLAMEVSKSRQLAERMFSCCCECCTRCPNVPNSSCCRTRTMNGIDRSMTSSRPVLAFAIGLVSPISHQRRLNRISHRFLDHRFQPSELSLSPLPYRKTICAMFVISAYIAAARRRLAAARSQATPPEDTPA